MTEYIHRSIATGDCFYPTPNTLPNDREITYEALGMLVYIMSKPKNWKVIIADLERKCSSGRVRRILNELIEHGYVERETIRNPNGTIRAIQYHASDKPIFCNSALQENYTLDGFPEVDKPLVENRALQIQNNTNTEKDSCKSENSLLHTTTTDLEDKDPDTGKVFKSDDCEYFLPYSPNLDIFCSHPDISLQDNLLCPCALFTEKSAEKEKPDCIHARYRLTNEEAQARDKLDHKTANRLMNTAIVDCFCPKRIIDETIATCIGFNDCLLYQTKPEDSPTPIADALQVDMLTKINRQFPHLPIRLLRIAATPAGLRAEDETVTERIEDLCVHISGHIIHPIIQPTNILGNIIWYITDFGRYVLEHYHPIQPESETPNCENLGANGECNHPVTGKEIADCKCSGYSPRASQNVAARNNPVPEKPVIRGRDGQGNGRPSVVDYMVSTHDNNTYQQVIPLLTTTDRPTLPVVKPTLPAPKAQNELVLTEDHYILLAWGCVGECKIRPHNGQIQQIKELEIAGYVKKQYTYYVLAGQGAIVDIPKDIQERVRDAYLKRAMSQKLKPKRARKEPTMPETKRNELMQALLDAFGKTKEQLNDAEMGLYRRAVKQLSPDTTVADVERAYKWCVAQNWDKPFGAGAIPKHINDSKTAKKESSLPVMNVFTRPDMDAK